MISPVISNDSLLISRIKVTQTFQVGGHNDQPSNLVFPVYDKHQES